MWPRMFSASEPGPGWVRAMFSVILRANMAHEAGSAPCSVLFQRQTWRMRLGPRHVRFYFNGKHGTWAGSAPCSVLFQWQTWRMRLCPRHVRFYFKGKHGTWAGSAPCSVLFQRQTWRMGWVRAMFGSISKANMAHELGPRHVRFYFKGKHGA